MEDPGYFVVWMGRGRGRGVIQNWVGVMVVVVLLLDREYLGLCEVGSGVDSEIPGDSGEDTNCAKEKDGEEGEEYEQRPSGHVQRDRGGRQSRLLWPDPCKYDYKMCVCPRSTAPKQ